MSLEYAKVIIFSLPITVTGPFSAILYDSAGVPTGPSFTTGITLRTTGTVRVVLSLEETFSGSLALWGNGNDPQVDPPLDEFGIDPIFTSSELTSPEGIGPVIIDSISTGNKILRGDTPIDDCSIIFYRKSEYQLGLRNRRATTVSDINGDWGPVNLDPETYVAVVYDPAVKETWAFDIVVSF